MHIKHWSRDCFINKRFKESYEELRKSPVGKKRYPLVFYPHGSLCLITTPDDGESKLTLSNSGNDKLLNKIFQTWTSKEADPLIVCEGTSREKMRVISQSPYLSTIHEHILPNIGRTLVAYGWGLAEYDHHILEQLAKSRLEKLAISIKLDEFPDSEAAEIHCQGLKSRILAYFQKYKNKPQIYFFDSTSPKCWNNP